MEKGYHYSRRTKPHKYPDSIKESKLVVKAMKNPDKEYFLLSDESPRFPFFKYLDEAKLDYNKKEIANIITDTYPVIIALKIITIGQDLLKLIQTLNLIHLKRLKLQPILRVMHYKHLLLPNIFLKNTHLKQLSFTQSLKELRNQELVMVCIIHPITTFQES